MDVWDINLQNPINYNNPLNRGLQGWWLNVPQWRGGTFLRDLCRRFDGTLLNFSPSEWIGPRGRPGGFGALDFDGVNNSVDIINSPGSILDNATNSFSICFWFAGTAAGGGNANGLIYKRETRVTSPGYSLTLASGAVRCVISDGVGGNATLTVSGGGNNDGVWHYAQFIVERGVSCRIWTDGRLRQTSSSLFTSSIGNSTRLSIGNSTINGAANLHPYTGQIDDVRIYGRALSIGEIIELYKESRQGYPNALNRSPIIMPEILNLVSSNGVLSISHIAGMNATKIFPLASQGTPNANNPFPLEYLNDIGLDKQFYIEYINGLLSDYSIPINYLENIGVSGGVLVECLSTLGIENIFAINSVKNLIDLDKIIPVCWFSPPTASKILKWCLENRKTLWLLENRDTSWDLFNRDTQWTLNQRGCDECC